MDTPAPDSPGTVYVTVTGADSKMEGARREMAGDDGVAVDMPAVSVTVTTTVEASAVGADVAATVSVTVTVFG